ncbi:MAG: hypothetical protein AAGG50_12945, partial [Bacteroidota bacterium]
VAAPVLTGSYGARDFTGTAADDRTDDTGLASVTLRDATNMSISVTSFAQGAASTTFRVTLNDPRQPGEGYVVATDVAGNEEGLLVSTVQAGLRTTGPSATTEDGGATAEDTAYPAPGTSPDDLGNATHGPPGEDRAAAPSGDALGEHPGSLEATPAEATDTAPRDRRPSPDKAPREVAPDATRGTPDAGRAATPDEATQADLSEPTASNTEASGSETPGSEARDLDREAPAPDRDARSSDDATETRPVRSPEASASIPEAFAVDVYPNPGDARRHLLLQAPEEMTVTITLTDLVGRRVLERRVRLAPGVHRLDLDLGTVAAGTYVLDAAAADVHRVLRLSVSR